MTDLPCPVPALGPGRVDAVVLDLDDTLLDTRGAFVHALAAVTDVYLPHLGAERREEVVRHWRADVEGHYRRYTRGEAGYAEQRMARANALHRDLGGPPLDGDGFAAWDALFERGFRAAWAAHHDAAPLLAALAARAVPTGVLTNAAVAYQQAKLDHAGLDLPLLVGVDTLGVGKPDPRVFHEACRRLGTAPGRTAYVGDELDVDGLAAAEAGLVGVWLDRPGARRSDPSPALVARGRRLAVHVVAGLDEVPVCLGLGA